MRFPHFLTGLLLAGGALALIKQLNDKRRDVGAVERKLERARAQVKERQIEIARLRSLITRRQDYPQHELSDVELSTKEDMFADLSTAVSLLMAAKSEYDRQERHFTAEESDVIRISASLISVLEDHGMEVYGDPDELVPFDPDKHCPLSDSTNLQIGDLVILRLPGISHCTKVILPAYVEAKSEYSTCLKS